MQPKVKSSASQTVRQKLAMLAIASCLVVPMSALGADTKDLEGGSSEMQSIYKDMTPAGIQDIIRQEIKQHCNSDGLCSIFGIETKTNTHWELSFSAGTGSNQGNGQNNYYIGGTQNSNNERGYLGATLTIKGPVTCKTNVLVDPSVYRLIKSYMYNNVKNDGKVARDFTEAEKTVMMFYGKIIEKAATCQNQK